jgi:hypothetical protein
MEIYPRQSRTPIQVSQIPGLREVMIGLSWDAEFVHLSGLVWFKLSNVQAQAFKARSGVYFQAHQSNIVDPLVVTHRKCR